MSEQTVSDATGGGGRPRGEDLHVRNYDGEAHVLWVRAVDDDGWAFEQTYDLPGLATAGELDVLPPGRYDVEVELDGLRRWVRGCTVAADPPRGVLVETGNGAVSITEVPRS